MKTKKIQDIWDHDEMQRLVDAYFVALNAGIGTGSYESNEWALEQLEEFKLNQPEQLWNFVVTAYKRKLSPSEKGSLAAGPLEELISRHGSQYIDKIEVLARHDADFAYILRGVWTPDDEHASDVWSRIERLQHIDKGSGE